MRIGRWISERWPVSAVLYWGLHEPIPGGPRFAYVLGSSTLFLFVLQVITGIWQMFYYVPTVDHAYDSLMYLRLQVGFGWLIHGLHYWGATAFLIVMGLHVVRTFIWGAYKKPRELVWLLGVLLLLLGAMLMFTGAVLPWDLMGYWAGQVGLSISGTVPLIGNFIETVLQGGASMGQLTLMRFFVLHVAILPVLASLLILAHVVAFRQFGSVGPWTEARRQTTGWFWPDQLLRDLIVFCAIFLLLVGLSAYFPAPIPGPADPLDQTYTPKPEWNFLFLYQALKAFKGTWEPVGTVGLPLLLVFLLVLFPFIDRREQRNPRKRPLAMICGLMFAGGVLSLTVLGFLSSATPPATSASTEAATSSAPQAGGATADPAAVKRGGELFNVRGCNACHSLSGQPGLGPDLSSEAGTGRSASWLVAQIRDPKQHNPDTIMPAYRKLTDSQVQDLVSFMMSLKGPSASTRPSPAALAPATSQPADTKTTPGPPTTGGAALAAGMIGNAAHGRTLYGQYCGYCHGEGAMGVGARSSPRPGVIPPLSPIRKDLFSSDPARFADNIDRIIQNGSMPPGGGAVMPAFGATNALTQPQIANIEAYILDINGVDRAAILNPGMRPEKFFLVCAAVSAFAALVLSGGSLLMARRRRQHRS